MNWLKRLFKDTSGQLHEPHTPTSPTLESKARFFGLLKEEFFPRLRAAGFVGSRQHFCRVRGEVMHAINIQSRSDGESCAVNLGIHLTFLPIVGRRDLAAPRNIKEIDCEFRRRLALTGTHDHWWVYVDAGRSEASLIETFFAIGEPWFARFSSVAAIAADFDHAKMSSGTLSPALAEMVPARAALAAARIHAHLGNISERRRFARLGLTLVGHATALREDLEKLASVG